jgi:hypothetical protein
LHGSGNGFFWALDMGSLELSLRSGIALQRGDNLHSDSDVHDEIWELKGAFGVDLQR